jgi:F-type H+-transporting ATPase subunit gamma
MTSFAASMHRIVELIDLRNIRQVGFSDADVIGKKIISMFEAGEFDVATLFFSRFRR